MSANPRFLAVVEVPFEQRVRCSAEGCGHSVYRHIHVVNIEGRPRLFGSDCFARLFGDGVWATGSPYYGNRDGRVLSEQERALLVENTEALIAQFEAEAARQRVADPAFKHPDAWAPSSADASPERPRKTPIASCLSRGEAEAIARKRLEQRFQGINLNLPGWVGLLADETEDVLREHAA